ncbi:MAG: hypothetical protein Q8N92_01725 [Erysipelotrichaceae bacterium]|nr:hypothetical protein [Erysipelotrichaceae bacterium]
MKLMRPLKNNKGMALITVVLIFLILVIMLGGAMFVAVANQRNALFANDHTEAYYVAESGLNTRISQIESYLNNPGADYAPGSEDLKEYLADAMFTINANKVVSVGVGNFAIVDVNGPLAYGDLPGADVYIIRSTGYVRDVIRTLEVEVVIYLTYGSGDSSMNKAVISRSSIWMRSNNGLIRGDVFTNGEVLPINYSPSIQSGPLLHLADKDQKTIYNKENPDGAGNSVAVSDGYCDNIWSIAMPTGTTLSVASYTQTPGNSLGCFDARYMEYKEEAKRIFPSITMPSIPTSGELLEVFVQNGVLELPDLRRHSGKKGYYLASLNTSSNITISLGNYGYATQLKKLVVGTITATSGTLRVEGTGRVMVMRKIDETNTTRSGGKYIIPWGANVIVQRNDPTKFILVLDTWKIPPLQADLNTGFMTTVTEDTSFNPEFQISNNISFTGSLMFGNVDVNMQNVPFKGYIITAGGDINFASNSTGSVPDVPVWIYAPIAHVVLGSNATIYGSIMAKVVELSANSSSVIYRRMDALPLFDYLFYVPSTGTGNNEPENPVILFSNIVEVDTVVVAGP